MIVVASDVNCSSLVGGDFIVMKKKDMHVTLLDRQRLWRQAKMSLYMISMV